MERCEVCGFAWDEVDRDEIAGRVDAGTADIAALIVADPERSAVRPSPQRWSATQYAAHVRDVLNTIRDRLVIGLVEDDPTFNAMYRDERVTLGLYDGDPAPAVADELRSATASFIRLFGAVDPGQLGRPVQYGVPTPTRRTLLWMGQQAVHEVEHHRDDIIENLRPLAG
jgi:DinB superfamily